MNSMDPPGYAPLALSIKDVSSKKGKRSAVTTTTDSDETIETARIDKANELKLKKAWELALAPAKSLPMQAFMLYMSGSGIQIFSMGIVWMLLTSPWSAVAGILKVFEPYKQTIIASPSSSDPSSDPQDGIITKRAITTELVLPMLVFVLCQTAVLALGIYKCSTMGLLPLGTGDWLAFETRGSPPEWSAVRLESMLG